jgi:hypothetical protein
MTDLDFERFVPMLKDLRELVLKYDLIHHADVPLDLVVPTAFEPVSPP